MIRRNKWEWILLNRVFTFTAFAFNLRKRRKRTNYYSVKLFIKNTLFYLYLSFSVSHGAISKNNNPTLKYFDVEKRKGKHKTTTANRDTHALLTAFVARNQTATIKSSNKSSERRSAKTKRSRPRNWNTRGITFLHSTFKLWREKDRILFLYVLSSTLITRWYKMRRNGQET